jgi:adenosylmethionine-8-amino-7-oxononanoate aminotransferase
MDGTTIFDAKPLDRSQVHSGGRRLVDGFLNEPPLEVVASEGNYLYLRTGQMVFDATCGAAVSCLGHGNQEVIQAITDQLGINTYSNSMVFTTSVATQLADEIILGTDNLMSRVYICSSGTTSSP